MSSQHPIDALVRSKLEQRSFPAEAGEMDDMRSLIDLHNASSTTKVGAARWGWALLLLPAAVLLWWNTSGADARNGEQPTRGAMAEMRSANEAATPPHQKLLASVANETSGNSTLPSANANSTKAATTEPFAKHARTAGSFAHPHSPAEAVNDRAEVTLSSGGSLARTQAEPLEARYMNTLFELAASHALMAQAPLPSLYQTAATRERALGDLYFLGAEVSTDAASANASGKGSWFGIEYRMKTKHFSAATGIHYGSYTFSTDPAINTCDVRLDYMQVPLLAGYERSLGRWGVLAQAGITCDLFFQATGRYGAKAENATRTIDDSSFRTVNMQVLLRPQLMYRVNEQLGFVAGPVWSQQLSTLASAGPLAGARTTNTGLAFGLTWRLARSTY